MLRDVGKPRSLLLVLLLVCATSVGSVAFADGVIRDGLGAISVGRGGTNLAHADNGVIILDNPAAMTNIGGSTLAELSFDTLLTDLRYIDPQNDVRAEVKPYPMGQLGIVRKDASGNRAFGLGIFAPAGFGAEWDVFHPAFGTRRQKSFGALVKVLPSFAVKLSDQLSVGGAVGVAASHAELEGPFHLQSGAPGTPALLDLQTTGAAVTWNLGLQYQLSEQTTVGVAYTGETRMQLDGSARATVPGPMGSSTFDAELAIAWPRSLGMGVSHAPCTHRRYSVDVIWYDWSSAFDSFDMTLSNPSSPAFLVLGDPFQDRFPLNWHDTISIRTGSEFFLDSERVLRLGYVYHNNPIPDSTLTSFIPATLEHATSVGYGWRHCDWKVDLAYQFSWGRRRSVTTSAIAGSDFDNSSVYSMAHWISFSFVREY